MLKSIGDFTVDITPTFNMGKLEKGIQTLGNIGNITRLFDFGARIGRSMAGIVTDTAEATSEMYLFAQSIGQPIGKVDLLRRAFVLSGASAQTADQSMQSLLKTVMGFKYGEGNFELLGKAGITPQMFSGDPFKDINMLANKFSKMNAAQRQYFISGANMGPDSLRYLSMESKERQKILSMAQQMQLATEKQGRDSFEFMKNMEVVDIKWQSFKRTLVSDTLPELTKALHSLNELIDNKEFMTMMKDLTSALTSFVQMTSGLFSWFSEANEGSKKRGDALQSMSAGKGIGFLSSGFSSIKEWAMTQARQSMKELSSNTTIQINANGMGAKEHAEMIADKVKKAVSEKNKDTYKNVIDNQPKSQVIR